MGRGCAGRAPAPGALYGWTISIGTAVVVMFTVALDRSGVDEQSLALVFPGAFTIVFATLYMVGAPLSGTRTPFVVGLVLCLAALVATTVAVPHHWLVYAVSGCTFFFARCALGPCRRSHGRCVRWRSIPSSTHPFACASSPCSPLTLPDPADELPFLQLQRELDLTAGNLTTHLARLEDAGYVAISKGFHGRKPVTHVALAPAGRLAFATYREELLAMLSAPSQQYVTERGTRKTTHCFIHGALSIASSSSRYVANASRPAGASATWVTGLRPWKPFEIATYPASSSRARWVVRLPAVRSSSPLQLQERKFVGRIGQGRGEQGDDAQANGGRG